MREKKKKEVKRCDRIRVLEKILEAKEVKISGVYRFLPNGKFMLELKDPQGRVVAYSIRKMFWLYSGPKNERVFRMREKRKEGRQKAAGKAD